YRREEGSRRPKDIPVTRSRQYGRCPPRRGTPPGQHDINSGYRTNRMTRMHVYLKEEQVLLRMEEVDGQGLVPDGAELVPMAFFASGNRNPSFRALLPPDTLDVLRNALHEPVTLGVLAEEPEDESEEIRAMVGLAVPIARSELEVEDEETEAEPWRASIGDSEAWRGEDSYEPSESEVPRTALL